MRKQNSWFYDAEYALVVVDPNKQNAQMLTNRFLMESMGENPMECECVVCDDIDSESIASNIESECQNAEHIIILTEASLLKSVNFHEFENEFTKVYTYIMKSQATDAERIENDKLRESKEQGFPTYGVVADTQTLIERLKKGDRGLSDVQYGEDEDEDDDQLDDNPAPVNYFNDDEWEEYDDKDDSEDGYEDDLDDTGDIAIEYTDDYEDDYGNEAYDDTDDADDDIEPEPVNPPTPNRKRVQNVNPQREPRRRTSDKTKKASDNAKAVPSPSAAKRQRSGMRTNENTRPAKTPSAKNGRQRNDNSDIIRQLRGNMAEFREQGFDDIEEISAPKKKAFTITVGSAKGGVGKTTISAFLAAFLAMTQNEKGERCEVAVVDFNIDFSNVADTLNVPYTDALPMDTWAEDISNKMRICDSEDIEYTQDEIRNRFLTHEETSGVYILCGSASPENVISMHVQRPHIEVIMRNLIENGGFDYVIVDTGNNLRDTVFIPMQKADICFLVVEQDINAVMSNITMLSTLYMLGDFDMSKIYLLYNRTTTKAEAGMSTSEISQAYIKNMKTEGFSIGGDGKNIVYGEIPLEPKVKRMVNLGKIVVTDPDNAFTRAIAEIAAKLNGTQYELTPPKKGLLARILSFGHK